MDSIKIHVDQELSTLRLDQAIASTGRLSRGKARKILDLGGCYLNRKRIRRASATLKAGDQITVFWRDWELDAIQLSPQVIEKTNILYEDDEILAINKPQGLPSQATRTQIKFHVAPQCEVLMGKPSPHIVHRLDRDTTGVMLLAKTKKAYNKLTTLFMERKVEKEYHCLVNGPVKEKEWVCTESIGKIKAEQGRVFIDNKRGLQAETKFTVLETMQSQVLIKAEPVTGRTHQIRVHLEHSGYPIIGDKNYGGFANGVTMKLHAKKIRFPYWKTNKILEISAPYPQTFLMPNDLN